MGEFSCWISLEFMFILLNRYILPPKRHKNRTTLIPQHYNLTLFISSWATKSCPGFCHVRFFTYLSVAIRKQAKIVTRRCKGTNKIRKTHTFWRNFFNHGEIWLHAFTRYRLNTGSEMPQYHRISVQRDSPFADERLFLWRLMRGRCNVTTDAPSLVSSYPSYMQLWYHPQSHQESSGTGSSTLKSEPMYLSLRPRNFALYFILHLIF